MKFNLQISKVAILYLTMAGCLLAPQVGMAQNESGYIARQDSSKGLFDALSSRIKKPIIISKLVAAKKISGEFDFQNPQELLEKISDQLGLIWYHDGQTIYIYNASEMRSEMIALRNTSFNVVNNFLRKSGLYDHRYPLRSDNVSGAFYVSGPPVYVDLVVSTAKFLDEKTDGFDGRSTVASIPLFNTFVEDRYYKYREDNIRVPGVASVIRSLLGNSNNGSGTVVAPTKSLAEIAKQSATALTMPEFPGEASTKTKIPNINLSNAVKQRPSPYGFEIVSNPGTNSLLVKGSAEQVSYVQNIVTALDIPKRHIELSVWIVDLQKEMLEQLGIEWSGAINTGGQLGVSFNGGSASTVDGASFMASVLALTKNDKANIVSRPMVLTQENIPAIFDNSKTFYTKLIGERSVELQHITYGTSLNVLPRFTDENEIEMMLSVEDGSQYRLNEQGSSELPEVGRTNISTVARVPRGKSLLIGGYSRDEHTNAIAKVPLLGDLPLIGNLFSYKKSRDANMVRVFLIQPREIFSALQADDASVLITDVAPELSEPQLQDWMRNYMDANNGS